MAKIINIDIDEKGDFTVDLTGFQGKGCDAIIKAFSEVGDITKEVHKREYFDTTKTQTTNVQRTGN